MVRRLVQIVEAPRFAGGAALAVCLPFCIAWASTGRWGMTLAAVVATALIATGAWKLSDSALVQRRMAVFGAAARITPDLVVEFSRDGVYLTVSGYVAHLYPASNNIGKTIHEVLPPDVALIVRDALREADRTGERQIITYELDVGPSARFWESHVAPTDTGTFVLIARNITASIDRENEASELASFMKTLAYSAGHDLGKGLRASANVVGAIGVQLASMRDPELKQLGEALKRQGHHMSRLSTLGDGLNKLLRLRSSDDLKREVLSMGEIARSARDLVVGQPGAEDAQFDVAEDLPMVSGHRELLITAVENLLSNAVKYQSPDRTLRVAVTREADSVVVRDNGRGFEQRQEPDMWLAGKRLHAGGVGNGLGLTTVKRIVELLGGSISAVGAPDAGAAFTIHLPVVER